MFNGKIIHSVVVLRRRVERARDHLVHGSEGDVSVLQNPPYEHFFGYV